MCNTARDLTRVLQRSTALIGAKITRGVTHLLQPTATLLGTNGARDVAWRDAFTSTHHRFDNRGVLELPVQAVGANSLLYNNNTYGMIGKAVRRVAGPIHCTSCGA